MNLETCNFCVFGFKNSYNTFRHIHEAFYRALKFKYPERQVLWLDSQDDLFKTDFSNTFFISMSHAVDGMPRRKDCMYAVHHIESAAKEYLTGLPLLHYGLYVDTIQMPSNAIQLDQDAYFFPQPWEAYDAVVFRWGTDLLPDEIQNNKPDRVFRNESREINYIGTPISEVQPFMSVCAENGIQFNRIGGYSGTTPVSIEENVRLVQKSYMAPAISDDYHKGCGYIPCRLFKNISYGQIPLTNNKFANDSFQGRLIYNGDARQLFYDGREQLANYKLEDLHALMDEVAIKHTYLNKIEIMLKAAKTVQESRNVS